MKEHEVLTKPDVSQLGFYHRFEQVVAVKLKSGTIFGVLFDIGFMDYVNWYNNDPYNPLRLGSSPIPRCWEASRTNV